MCFRRSTQITNELLIEDHGPPFKQIETYFEDENITEIIVEAHKEFDENTFFLIHDLKMRVAVISNQACIFSEIDAYNLKSKWRLNSETNQLINKQINDFAK